MMKQTVLLATLVGVLIWAFPLIASAQAETPSPFDDEEALPVDDNEGAADEQGDEPYDADEEATYEEEDKAPKVDLPLKKKAKVVQKKLFTKDLKHEINLFFGINPADSYVFSITEGVRYNFHPTEYLGLQLSFGYVHNFDRDSTKLLTDSVDKGGMEIDEDFIKHSEINWWLNLDLIGYPIYGKFSFAGSWIAHYDFGINVGCGIMSLENGDYAPAPDIGIVGNIYITEWFSIRADFWYAALIAEDDRKKQTQTSGTNIGGTTDVSGDKTRGGTLVRHNYFITLGGSFHFPVD